MEVHDSNEASPLQPSRALRHVHQSGSQAVRFSPGPAAPSSMPASSRKGARVMFGPRPKVTNEMRYCWHARRCLAPMEIACIQKAVRTLHGDKK
jgi:hypothetical protein